MDDQPIRSNKDAWVGVGITVVVNLILFLIPSWVFFVWLIQWVYILPCVILALILRRPRIAQGMLIGGGLTLVLNTALCGYIVSHIGN